MISFQNFQRPLIIIAGILISLALPNHNLQAQTAGFISPDTVCAGEAITVTNTTTGGSSYYWNFCSGNANQNPTGINIGNPGNLLDIPTYLTLVQSGTNYWSFVSCQGVGVVRYFHGNSFKNNPLSWTNLGTFGGTITFSEEGIQVKEDNGQWYGFVCSDTKLVRLNFGNSPGNTPTASSLNFSGLNMLHGLVIIKEGTTWLGFATCSTGNKMVRFNFGASLTNTPVMTDFGNFAGFSTPAALCIMQENSLWYGLVMAGGNTISRITFGTSLLNTPTGTNLGNPGGLNSAGGLTLLRDCESTIGYYTNYLSPGQLGKLTFPTGITGTVTGQVLGNIGNLAQPHSFSELFRQNDTLFAYITNRQNGTLTRLTFPPCSNSSVPSSTLFNPPSFSYNTAGTYNIRLIVNEGLPTQTSICKSIVVLAAPCNTVASFTAPDTVCVGEPISLTNQSTAGGTYYWSFCSGNALANPLGQNIGNPGNLLNVPAYSTLVKDGNTCYSFITNHGSMSVVRYNHGASFSNNPVSWTNLGGFGYLSDTVMGIKINNDNGVWIGIVLNSNRIVRLNFGTSLANTPTATMLGPYSMMFSAHCLDIIREGTTWIGFVTCTNTGNKLIRLNFGNSLLNPPVLTDLGIPGSMNQPASFRIINENGIWYGLVANFGNNTMTRLTFGNSLLNTPTGVNLGVVCPTINPGGITLIRDCEGTSGFQLNYSTTSTDLLWRLTFPTGITGTISGSPLGNIGSMSRPNTFSELFRVGDTLFVYVLNRMNFTITRLRFLPCSNASVPSSALFTPPTFSYNQPGVYNVQLIVNEGLPTQASVCKSIVTMPAPIVPLGADRSICPGTTTTLDAGAGFASYLWSTGATSQLITVGNAGSYWVKVTKYGCIDYDTVSVSLYPVTPVILGPDATVCEGQTATFNAGYCYGCSYVWSNLTTGQLNIGTDPTYTTGIPGIYSVKVTSIDGCINRDTIQLSMIAAPVFSINPPSQTICSGNKTSISLSSSSPLTTFSWIANIASGNITGFSAGFEDTIRQILTNHEFTAGSVIYSITAEISGCFSPAVACTVAVNPSPSITNAGIVAGMCSGDTTGFAISANISGTQFSWTATGNSPDLTGFGPGSGALIEQQLFNSGYSNPAVTYTVTPTALGCNGATGTFTAIVHPIPDVSFTPSALTVCTGGAIQIQLNSQAQPAAFSWEATGSSGFITNYSGGTGTSIVQSPQNTGSDPETVTYNVTPESNGCSGLAVPFIATVNPSPIVNVSFYPAAICSEDTIEVHFSSPTVGASFSWTAFASSPGVAGYSNGTGNSFTQTLENPGSTRETVTYIVTPQANGCNGTASLVEVFVKPNPDVSFSPVSQSVCFGQQTHVSLSSSFTGVTCSWTATGSSSAVTGYSDGSGNQINQTLFTAGTTAQTVTYFIKSTLDGCNSHISEANALTYPAPGMTINPTGQTICSGELTGITLASQVLATTFEWNANGSSNITGYSGGSGSSIAQILHNSSNTAGFAIYTITPSVANCLGQISSVTVSVSPKPFVTFTVCNDSITTTSAKPFMLRGGLPRGGTYSGPGVENDTALFDPSGSGIGLHPIIYFYSNVYNCSATAAGLIRVLPNPAFTCENTLTDVRDGREYSTFRLPNGRCWMKENLDFGVQVSDLYPQTDNCIAEYYRNPNSAISNPQSFYQWDELMDYAPVPGSKGLCPPGWHVPTLAEWMELLDFNLGQSQAAGPLKDLWLENGFQAIPAGLN
ncbi:MAG: PKD-like domain-containing protein, partial [Bacteroidota bacterium]